MDDADKKIDLQNPPPVPPADPPGVKMTDRQNPLHGMKKEGTSKALKVMGVSLGVILLVALVIAGIWLLWKAVGLAFAGIGWVLSKIWSGIVFVTPYGRQAAAEQNFLYCLHWASGCAAVFVILAVCICIKEYVDALPGTLATLAGGFGIWYIGFAMCFLLVRIPASFFVLAPIVQIVVCGAVGIRMLAFVSDL